MQIIHPHSSQRITLDNGDVIQRLMEAIRQNGVEHRYRGDWAQRRRERERSDCDLLVVLGFEACNGDGALQGGVGGTLARANHLY